MSKHIFVKASEELLRNYIEPNKHELNCVSCTLKFLQLVNEEQANEISEHTGVPLIELIPRLASGSFRNYIN